MPSSEEYRKRAKEARQEANVCRDEWERQRLLTIAAQCERGLPLRWAALVMTVLSISS